LNDERKVALDILTGVRTMIGMAYSKRHEDGSTEEQRGPLGACFLVTRADESGRRLTVVIDPSGEVLLRQMEGDVPKSWLDALKKWSPVMRSVG
jgi:hypothetical protein